MHTPSMPITQLAANLYKEQLVYSMQADPDVVQFF